MKLYIVSKIVDSMTEPETTMVSAHIDKDQADAAAKTIAGRVVVGSALQGITYGVVEDVELDLTGDGPELTQLRDEVIRQQMRMARAGGR